MPAMRYWVFFSLLLIGASSPAQNGAVYLTPKESAPLVLSKPNPDYPHIARATHLQGSVEVLVAVGEDGTITDTRAIHGQPMLAHAAIDAVKQMKFKPYVVNGKATPFVTKVMVQFVL